jgi:hypothetical protein
MIEEPYEIGICHMIEEPVKNEEANLWSNHVNYLAQDILKKHRLLGHALHPMQLLFIKKLQFIPCQNPICIQIYALEPNRDEFTSAHTLMILESLGKRQPQSQLSKFSKLHA